MTTVAVVGPTAAGKSSVAMAAARTRVDVSLVSVDAMQVYRGMDIGTAKPSPSDQAEVEHHLIDLVDPSETFTVGLFQEELATVRTDLAQRGRVPLYVGGTGLYLRAVTDGLELPGEWPELRAHLEAESKESGTPALYARLLELDPDGARKMEPTNTRRVVRALEVCLGSGRAFSSFGPGVDAYAPTDVVQVGLRWDRERLSERVEARVDAMLAAGFLGEVETLLARPHGWSRTARQALGYSELVDHIEGRTSLDEARDLMVTHTRQFAVRQLRWFRRDPRIRWIQVETDPVTEALPVVLGLLDSLDTGHHTRRT